MKLRSGLTHGQYQGSYSHSRQDTYCRVSTSRLSSSLDLQTSRCGVKPNRPPLHPPIHPSQKAKRATPSCDVHTCCSSLHTLASKVHPSGEPSSDRDMSTADGSSSSSSRAAEESRSPKISAPAGLVCLSAATGVRPPSPSTPPPPPPRASLSQTLPSIASLCAPSSCVNSSVGAAFATFAGPLSSEQA